MIPYYQDDHVTIYHGDCLNLIGDLKFDVVVADPPYGIAYTRGENNDRGNRGSAGIQNDESTDTRDTALLMADRPAIVFGSPLKPAPPNAEAFGAYIKPIDAGIYGARLRCRRDVETIYFCGFPATQGGPLRSSVFKSAAQGNRGIDHTGAHPHIKPLDVMAQLVALVDGTILDPFMGSGTTLRAAKDLGRKAIGIELEEKYCEIAAKRCAQEVLDFG